MKRIKQIKINEVWKKHFTIIAWLIGSWAVALLSAYLLKKPELAGLGPVLNYIGYAINLELKKEGFVKALK